MASDEWVAGFSAGLANVPEKIVIPVLLVHGGRVLLSGSAAGTPQLWDIGTKQTQQTLHVGTKSMF